MRNPLVFIVKKCAFSRVRLLLPRAAINATVETNATQPVDRMHDRAPSERAERAFASLFSIRRQRRADRVSGQSGAGA
jgi:hypothetical protein